MKPYFKLLLSLILVLLSFEAESTAPIKVNFNEEVFKNIVKGSQKWHYDSLYEYLWKNVKSDKLWKIEKRTHNAYDFFHEISFSSRSHRDSLDIPIIPFLPHRGAVLTFNGDFTSSHKIISANNFLIPSSYIGLFKEVMTDYNKKLNNPKNKCCEPIKISADQLKAKIPKSTDHQFWVVSSNTTEKANVTSFIINPSDDCGEPEIEFLFDSKIKDPIFAYPAGNTNATPTVMKAENLTKEEIPQAFHELSPLLTLKLNNKDSIFYIGRRELSAHFDLLFNNRTKQILALDIDDYEDGYGRNVESVNLIKTANNSCILRRTPEFTPGISGQTITADLICIDLSSNIKMSKYKLVSQGCPERI
jgi:hypothetical protein